MSVNRFGTTTTSITRRADVPLSSALIRDRFPILSITEITECLIATSISITEQDLTKPTAETMQFIYREILDLVFMVPPEKIQAIMDSSRQNRLDEGEEDQDEDDEEQMGIKDTVSLLIFNRLLYNFLRKCGFYDFGLADLTKPDVQRTKRILSAIINYVRFSNEHAGDNMELVDSNRQEAATLHQLQLQNEDYKIKIESLTTSNNKIKSNLDSINTEIANLEMEFRELRKAQQEISREHEEYKSEKSRLLRALEDDSYLLDTTKEALDEWKQKYLIESPQTLNKIVEDLKNRLEKERTEVTNLETRIAKHSISSETFGTVNATLKTIAKSLEEIKTDLDKYNQLKKTITQLRDSLQTKNNALEESKRKIALTNRQLKSLQDRIKRMNEMKNSRKDEYDAKMRNLDEEYRKINSVIKSKKGDLEGKQHRIDVALKEIDQIREQFEREKGAVNAALRNLKSTAYSYIGAFRETLDI